MPSDLTWSSRFPCWSKAASRRRNRVDRILVVDVPEAIQLERLVARDSVGIEEARAILAAQANRTDRLRAADDVLVNTGTVRELRQEVDRLHQRYLRLAGAMRP